MGEPEAKMEAINDPSNIDEDYVSDLSMFPSSLAKALSYKVETNVMLRSKHLCSTTIEILKSDYNDPYLQLRYKPKNARFLLNKTLGFGKIFGHEFHQRNFKMTEQNLLAKLQKIKFTNMVFAKYTLLDIATKFDPFKIEIDSSLLVLRVVHSHYGDFQPLCFHPKGLMLFRCLLRMLVLNLYCFKEVYKEIKGTRGRVLFNPERLMQEHLNQKLNFNKQISKIFTYFNLMVIFSI
jgi:hypothetical protein